MVNNNTTCLGILGGGQLARMLAEAAMAKGFRVILLASSKTAPAAIEGVELIVGSLEKKEDILALFSRSDYVTIENEFLDLALLQEALDNYPSSILHPSCSAISVAQDKLKQKKIFQDLAIPTASFKILPPSPSEEDLKSLLKRFPEGVILKWSRYGYDGRGNFVLNLPLDQPDVDKAFEFCSSGHKKGAVIYAEQKIDFACELAMVSTRGSDGKQEFFPLVISKQERGICREILGPATHFDIESNIELQAREILQKIGVALDFCGTFAVEFFITKKGDLLVNEMAPRVHNSGHYTLFGDEPSQFDLHIEAVMQQALSKVQKDGFVLMRNILGPVSLEKDTVCPAPTPSEPAPKGSSLYWYDKTTASPGRKMGHLTGRASTHNEALNLLERMSEYEERFWSNISIRH